MLYGCSIRKNDSSTRHYQAFITKYNIHYNGDKHYTETLEDMENSYSDDYEQLLLPIPAFARFDKDRYPQPIGDFTRSIEKAQKAILLRSIKQKPRGRARTAEEIEWKNRAEYNPFLHNSWLLLGKSLFMQGDFQQASAVFGYITLHFNWLPEIVAEAQMWHALSSCAMDEFYDAQRILSQIKKSNLKSRENLYYFALAETSTFIGLGNYEKAVMALKEGIEYSKGNRKLRLTYLLAQLMCESGKNNDEAYNILTNISSGFNNSNKTKLYARSLKSKITPITLIDKEINSLKKQLAYESYSGLKNLILYSIANLYLLKKDTTATLEYLNKAMEVSGQDNLAGRIALEQGNLLFERDDFSGASESFNSAGMFLNQQTRNYADVKLLGNSLEKYKNYSDIIHYQDSLLNLSNLGREYCDSLCNQLAERYKTAVKSNTVDGNSRIHVAESRMLVNVSANNSPSNFNISQPKVSWYFDNPMMLEQGKINFLKKWGVRKLEDDWRRKNKNSFTSFSNQYDIDNNAEDLSDDETSLHENQVYVNDVEDPSSPDFYLSNIPFTESQKKKCGQIIAESLYGQALLLINNLGRINKGIDKLEEIILRYPNDEYALNAYHELFLLALKHNKLEKAESYRMMITALFPDTEIGVAMKSKDYISRRIKMREEGSQLYNEAYSLYLDGNMKEVHSLCENALKDFDEGELFLQFHFLNALAYGTENNREKFVEHIKPVAELSNDLRRKEVASGMLRNIESGKQLRGDGSKIVFDSHLSGFQISEDIEESDFLQQVVDDNNFVGNNEPRIVIIEFPSTVNANGMLYSIALHNFSTYISREFDLELIPAANINKIIVRGFNNIYEAIKYKEMLIANSEIDLPENTVIYFEPR